MSKCHVFLVDDAVEHGIEKAVILYNLRFWLDKVKANNKERSKHEGYYWTFNSVTAFKELFPYLSEGQLQRHLKGLEKDGVILAGVFNKKGYDRTKWYSMPEFKIDDTVHQNQQDHSLDLTNDFIGIDEPIPYVNTDVSADVNTNTKENEKDLDGFDVIYERLKNKLRASGVIPIGKPVIDEHLRPDIYQFVSWCNSKNMEAYKQDNAVVAFFKKKDIEDRKKYYTPAADLTGRYYNEDNYQKAIPVTKEQAAAIEAKHAETLLGLGF